jgi:hypothetical protein
MIRNIIVVNITGRSSSAVPSLVDNIASWHRAYSLRKDESCDIDGREGAGSQAVTVFGDAIPILETCGPDFDPCPASCKSFYLI